MSPVPDRLYVKVPGVSSRQCRQLSVECVRQAKMAAPKMSGQSARGLDVYYGEGFFGIRWHDPYVWYQEHGVRPFTMRNLAGKTIPMWVNDADGKTRSDNPKAKTRTTVDGRVQVLIFRRAAAIGQRKNKTVRTPTGLRTTSVPASYPGAPGRIGQRHVADHADGKGRPTGRIAKTYDRPHVGVRWRFPGLAPKNFLHRVVSAVALDQLGSPNLAVHAVYRRR